MKEVYTAKPKNKTQENGQPWYGVDGPGNGLGYYSHTLYSELSYKTVGEATRAARLCNIAYEQGWLSAKLEVRRALGF